jgi:DNA ligase (NAD+)
VLEYESAGDLDLRCPNSEDCPAQLIERIINLGSRKALDIEALGEKTAQVLAESVIKSIGEIFDLDEQRLAQYDYFVNLDGGLSKQSQELLEQISAARGRPLQRMLIALSIRHVGPNSANLLARKFATVGQLAEASADQLAAISGIGPKIAAAIVDWFSVPEHQEIIRRWRARGVAFESDLGGASEVRGPLAGLTVVATGSLENWTRESVREAIERAGGKAAGSVSKNTDLVLAGQNAGSKLDKARQLGIKIISEADFQQLLNSADHNSG